MDLRCGCGTSCLKPASEVLEDFRDFFSPCSQCENWKLKKFHPLKDQIDLSKLDNDFGRCSCGKRHLDLVMAHILKVMMECGVKERESNLRNVCVPLITPAYPTSSIPYLPKNSLVILSPDLNKECAKRILNEVSEVKGVLKGDIKDTVGIKDVNSPEITYELLGGCDIRCDIVNTPYGALCIYKNQGQIHIEFPKSLSPKIEALKIVLDRFDKPTVVDCTCGPGTLGMAALKAGCSKVVFNDLWYPSALTTAINLKLNGFPVELLPNKTGLISSGEGIEVYCQDIIELKKVLQDKSDICLIDPFPGVDSADFVSAVQDICEEIVII